MMKEDEKKKASRKRVFFILTKILKKSHQGDSKLGGAGAPTACVLRTLQEQNA